MKNQLVHSPDSAKSRALSILLASGILLILARDLPAQSPVPPDHPSLSGDLIVWFTDPANTYDPITGVWTDSSGNGNDSATFTGNRNDQSGVDSSPFELTTATPDAGLFNGQSIDVIENGTEFNSLVTPSLNEGDGFSNLTIISLLDFASTNSLERLIGIGSFYLDDIRTAFMQSSDGSIRKDNGFIAPVGPLPQHHFIRASVLSGDGASEAVVRDFVFDDAGAGIDATLNIDDELFKGGHAKTGDDRIFIGDMRRLDEGSSVAQVAVFKTALTDQQIADVAAWMAANPNAGPGGGFAFQLALAHDADAGTLSIRWPSQAGKLYTLRSETAPSADAPVNWPVFDNQEALEATPPENSLTIPLPADALRFFVIEEFNPPPVVIFSDDFENGQGEWTTGSDGADGTAWELGTPSGFGPTAAHSPANCFATNLSANYGEDANAWLRSPVIDLTNAAGATLSYQQFVDIEEGFDVGQVTVLDAADNSELGVLQGTVDGVTTDWGPAKFSLPPDALGMNVRIEFRLMSDDFGSFAGWYLDDLEVTVP